MWLADISDHLPIFITLPYETSRQPKSQAFAYKRNYSSENMVRFKNDILNANWSSVYDSYGVDNKYNCFQKIIDKLHNDCFPLNKVKLNVKHQNKPCITPSILKSIRKKIICINTCGKITTFNSRINTNFIKIS